MLHCMAECAPRSLDQRCGFQTKIMTWEKGPDKGSQHQRSKDLVQWMICKTKALCSRFKGLCNLVLFEFSRWIQCPTCWETQRKQRGQSLLLRAQWVSQGCWKIGKIVWQQPVCVKQSYNKCRRRSQGGWRLKSPKCGISRDQNEPNFFATKITTAIPTTSITTTAPLDSLNCELLAVFSIQKGSMTAVYSDCNLERSILA